jgi:hypothetical protein
VSNSCPVIVPLASVAVFQLPPESRKYLCLLKGARFKSYSAHHFVSYFPLLIGCGSFRLLRVADDSRQGSVLLPATLGVRVPTASSRHD